ncbi:MAG: DUF4157 domain-containing protein [Burkholderiales bacterium]
MSEPGDAFEQEADRVADQVLRMSILGEGDQKDPSSATRLVQRCVSGGADQLADAPPIVHEVLRSPGQSLESATRAFFEPRFGYDFSRVRVHADERAAESARAVNALAYTIGADVVFAERQYSPEATAGRRLLAHELTHVIQQGGDAPLTASNGEDCDHLEPTSESGVEATQAKTNRVHGRTSVSVLSRHVIQRTVRPANVTCHQTGLTNPDLTGDEAVATIAAADADAIDLAREAEARLTEQLRAARAGDPVEAEFDTILQEELGLTLTNRAHFGLVQQQINRFRRVRETLESGYLRYMCRGSTVTPISLVGCEPEPCGDEFASSCPGNRLIVLCQRFWDTPDEQSATILHEPFHIWFEMARHAPNALRRADASCFESFALRVSGRVAFASCVDHTAG